MGDYCDSMPLNAAVHVAVEARRAEISKLLETVLGSDPFILTNDRFTWELKVRQTWFLRFDLSAMPGCCGVLISNGAVVYPEFRRLGLGRIFNQIRQHAAYLAGYTYLIATSQAIGKYENSILEKEGFERWKEFNNRRTTNNLIFWGKELTEPK